MTALKPIENRRVRAVASERYPLNAKCSHPECSEDAVDPHHAFPRSAIGGDSWFVEIETDDGKEVIPHVTGLCRSHHDDVEEHRAWIKLDDEGVWLWWDRSETTDAHGPEEFEENWTQLGKLNPQPGSREGKPKRRKHQGQARRQRENWQIRVPVDERENGAGLLDEGLDIAEAKMSHTPYDGTDPGDRRPAYYTLADVIGWFNQNYDPDEEG